MEPITILGLSLAGIVLGQSALIKMYHMWRVRHPRPAEEDASLPVPNTRYS